MHLKDNVGISGEFRAVVKRADGTVRLDTGFQSNMIVDNGIKFWLDMVPQNNSGVQQPEGRHRGFIGDYCVVGSGNQKPKKTDIKLINFVAVNTSKTASEQGVVQPSTAEGASHPGYAKSWVRRKYTFAGLVGKNVSEVGLCSWYGNETIGNSRYNNSYTLCTRALIKDSLGSPIVISVLEGEVLEVIYQVNFYFSVERQTSNFALTNIGANGVTTTETYDYFLQPYDILTGENMVYAARNDALRRSPIVVYEVKEDDGALNSSYDLNDAEYQKITSTDISAINKKVGANVTVENDTPSAPTADNYGKRTVTAQEITATGGYVTFKNLVGVNVATWAKGIRAFFTSVTGGDHPTPIMKFLVVVKNQKNGQGIKKTNEQTWSFNHTLTVTRWEE